MDDTTNGDSAVAVRMMMEAHKRKPSVDRQDLVHIVGGGDSMFVRKSFWKTKEVFTNSTVSSVFSSEQCVFRLKPVKYKSWNAVIGHLRGTRGTL